MVSYCQKNTILQRQVICTITVIKSSSSTDFFIQPPVKKKKIPLLSGYIQVHHNAKFCGVPANSLKGIQAVYIDIYTQMFIV